MSEKSDIASSVRKLAGKSVLHTEWATVTAVNDRMCNVTTLLGEAPVKNVRLNVITDASVDTGILITPSLNSLVIITWLNTTDVYVSLFSQIDSIVFNGGNLGGLVNIESLTSKLNGLINTVNTLIQSYNAHTHQVSTAGTAAAQTGIAAATAAAVQQATAFNQSDYEDTNIIH